jgi:uncharacterized protein YjiS (DUF1127 family)
MRNYFKTLFHKASLKREYEAMLMLDDRRLADLGLTRYDVAQMINGERPNR